MIAARVRIAPERTRTAPDERAARRSLRDQIARLEEDLTGLFTSSWPRTDLVPAPAAPARGNGARVLTLAELEQRRDALAEHVARAKHVLAERTAAEEESRRLIEEMLLDPAAHPWVHVSNEDIGEPGCKHWHVRPRAGLLGMLGRWWRVRISSGCPLARGAQAPREKRPLPRTSAGAIGRRSASDRSAASATRWASSASAAVHAGTASPRATSRKWAISAL